MILIRRSRKHRTTAAAQPAGIRFIGTVEQLKTHRQIVDKVMGRWRTPATATAMWAWIEYMQVVAQERKDKALDEARNQL